MKLSSEKLLSDCYSYYEFGLLSEKNKKTRYRKLQIELRVFRVYRQYNTYCILKDMFPNLELYCRGSGGWIHTVHKFLKFPIRGYNCSESFEGSKMIKNFNSVVTKVRYERAQGCSSCSSSEYLSVNTDKLASRWKVVENILTLELP